MIKSTQMRIWSIEQPICGSTFSGSRYRESAEEKLARQQKERRQSMAVLMVELEQMVK